jgi:hypothetical protein
VRDAPWRLDWRIELDCRHSLPSWSPCPSACLSPRALNPTSMNLANDTSESNCSKNWLISWIGPERSDRYVSRVPPSAPGKRNHHYWLPDLRGTIKKTLITNRTLCTCKLGFVPPPEKDAGT